jgi:hypothetical protein
MSTVKWYNCNKNVQFSRDCTHPRKEWNGKANLARDANDEAEQSLLLAIESAVTVAVGNIPNRYACDVVLNQQARVAHGGGMADSLLGGPVARWPMAVLEDAGAYGGFPR